MNDEKDQNQEALDEQHDCFARGDGWGQLIAELEANLTALSPNYKISQVKEKFGGLRYYANPGDVDEQTSKRFYNLVHEAEAKSYEICECCGQPGRLARRGERGWYKTLCWTCSGRLSYESVRDDEGSATS